MNKKIKIFITIFFFLFFTLNCAKASLLWEIDNGVEEFRKENYKVAKDYFINYIKSNPNDEEGYYWLARTYWHLKDEKKANENFKKAHEIMLKEKNIQKLNFNYSNSSNIEDYFDMAAMYFEAGNMEDAESYADMMLKINPKSPSAYFIKAKIAQINGNDTEAIEHINKAIIFNNKLIKTNLAKSLNVTQMPEITSEMYETFALEAYFSEDITSAIRYCRRYLEKNPTNFDMTNMLIDLYIKNNEIVLAEDLIKATLDKNGNNLQTILYQAKLYQLKKDDRLEETLLLAYKINPNNAKVLLELGNFYLKQNKFEEAKKYFETLVNVNDEMYEAYFGYIYSLCETGKSELAMNFVRKFLTFDSSSSEGNFLLYKLCERTGDFKNGYDYITKAIEKTKNPLYYFGRGKLNYYLKDYPEALDDFNKVLKFSTNEKIIEEAQDYLIKIFLKTNDLISAQMHLNKKLSLDKNRIMYKYNLYVLYKMQGNEKKALEQFNDIRKARLTKIQDLLDISELHFEEGNYEHSIKVLESAGKKTKEYPVYFQKIKIYSLLNQTEELKETLDELSKIN